MINQPSIEDVGKTIEVDTPYFYTIRSTKRRIQMVIKTPKGQLTLFSSPTYHETVDKKCQAIKEFMEQ